MLNFFWNEKNRNGFLTFAFFPHYNEGLRWLWKETTQCEVCVTCRSVQRGVRLNVQPQQP